MKKKGKILLIISIFSAILGCFSVNAIENNTSGNNKDQSTLEYTLKSIYDLKEDNWIYSMEIAYDIDGEKPISYVFDGYNLKGKSNDNNEYYIPYIDRETGKEIDRIPSQYLTLSTSSYYRDEIEKISEFLNNKKFNQEISVNDLTDLDIEKIDKNYLVDLFNRTISSSLKNEAGDYINASSLNKKTLESTDENMPGHWQIMYLLDYGNIEKVNIEFIDENGTYISDIKDTTQENKELYNKIETIENQIIKNQSMSIPQTRSNTNTINQDLINLLDSVQEEISQ